MIAKRKELRNNPTHAEVFLWQKIKQSQLGYKFRRQHSIGPFILDFYCPNKKLAIELDGSQHYSDEGLEYDAKRTDYLKSHGMRVLRFSNLDVENNMNGVLMKIEEELNAPPLTPP